MQSNFVFGRTNPKSPRVIQPASPFWQNELNHPLLGGSYRSPQPFRKIPRVRSRSFENASFESCRLSQPVRSPPAHVRRRLETEFFGLPSVRREDKMLPEPSKTYQLQIVLGYGWL